MKCPKCNAEIDHLNNYQSGEDHSKLYLNGDKEHIHYEDQEFQANGQVNDFECPECKETLFTDEDKAIKFLKGGLNET